MAEAGIEDRIRKLFKKAERTDSEEERRTYVEKAQSLMTKYAIEQLTEEKEPGDTLGSMGRTEYYFRGDWSKQEIQLLASVFVANDCKGVQRNATRTVDGKIRKFIIVEVYGYEEDRKRVDYLNASLQLQMKSAIAQYRKENAALLKNLGSWDRYVMRRSFADGFVNGLATYLQDARSRATTEATGGDVSSSTALALVSKGDRVSAYYDEQVGPTRKARASSRNVEASAWLDGQEAGKSAGGSTGSSIGGRGTLEA